MLLGTETQVILNGRNIRHYKDLWYNGEINDTIIVKIDHLTIGSHAKVKVLCDYCQTEISEVTYKSYLYSMKSLNKYACKKCHHLKSKESNLIKYGTPYISQLDEIKEKQRKTVYEKYGCSNISQNNQIKQKKKERFIDIYGEEYGNILSNRMLSGYYEKTGYKNPQHDPIIREKVENTVSLRYGYKSVSQVPEIREKQFQSLYKNGSQKTSRQQRYIFDLYSQSNPSAELNYPVSHYSADICFPEEKLVVEVDFGGHDLAVNTGKITQEEFNQKEIIRNNILKREGYKSMHITSTKDLLPSDTTLLQLLSYARQYFSEYPNHSWINFSIDTLQVFNAENKEGIFFNYGDLHRLKQLA